MNDNWKCPNCGYLNEHYLIVCVCGQRKGQPPTGYVPPKIDITKEATQKQLDTRPVNKSDKMPCPHCDEMISASSIKCPICAELISNKSEAASLKPQSTKRPFNDTERPIQTAAKDISRPPKSGDVLTEMEVKINKLKQLMDRGLITQTEFDQRRKKLIDEYMA